MESCKFVIHGIMSDSLKHVSDFMSLLQDFREKNVDQVRPDIVSVLKSSNLSFLRELMGEIFLHNELYLAVLSTLPAASTLVPSDYILILLLYGIVGLDPVAVLRWSIIKTLVKSVFAFIAAGRTYRSNGGM